ncbi:LicD family protein [Gordonibacter massiliensis (ex Traore et al. 2017)]|uniref:LicD family protein n=1 Tax=Gordonibacter massiliensis (ex Traore et al. 2017) TaxID=1841863 RepID=A0A842JM91_9ACTN|nr:LicD family protein [Gordonibacter massiliensis (ex Traore et al. 2017)]
MKQTIDQFYDSETLRRLQLIELDILKRFDAMCKKHGLQYFALYGTVLGAIRHQGFIPWDDDIDIGMPRKDYERLAELVPLEFGSGYSLLNGQINPRYPFMTSRIMKKGTEFRMLSMKNLPCELGIFLDIFCFDNIPNDVSEQKRMARKCWIVEKMCILRNTPFPNLPYRGFKRVAAYTACGAGSIVMRALPRKKLHEWMQSSAQRYNRQETDYIGCPFGLDPFESIYPKSMLFPLRTAQFEDMEIPLPNDAHAMMRQVYGDTYMTPPPEGKRSFIIPYKLSFGDEGDTQ